MVLVIICCLNYSAFKSFHFFFTVKECKAVIDIAFVIDSSASIGVSSWDRKKRFLKAIVSKLDVSASGTHVAAVAYSTNAEVVLLFSNGQSTDEVNKAFDDMHWQEGFTFTDKGLLLADRILFETANGMRPDVSKVNEHVVYYRQNDMSYSVQ